MSTFARWDGETILPTITVESTGANRFTSVVGQPNNYGSVFGGQFMGQALEAASLTIDGQGAHAAAGFFLQRGDPTRPLDYDVDRVFDGRTFSARRVTCSQAERTIFTLTASFQVEEDGAGHSLPFPNVPSPDRLARLDQLAGDFADRVSPGLARRLRIPAAIDLRPTEPEIYIVGHPQRRHRRVWLRLPTAAGAPDHSQRSVLTHATDYILASTAVLPHEAEDGSTDFFMASLNQSIWFYRSFRADEWLLCDCETPAAGGGRGVGRADIFNASGQLVASAIQEVLLRTTR